MHIKTVYCGFATKVVASALCITLVTGARSLAQQSPTPTPTCTAEDLPNRALDANLYMRTSAEYRASCYQAYNLATERLERLVRHERAKSKRPKELAVVMDLDETVFDNSGFQAMQLRSGNAYCQELWDKWEKDYADEIDLIPGAKEFILKFENEVSLVYISNRNEKFRGQAKKALERLGLPLKHEKDLKLSTGPTDKTARRQEAENDYKVLLYIGDNLRDFDETLAFDKLGFGEVKKLPDDRLNAVIKARKDALDKDPTIWGKEWIILPNPAYGDWTKPLGRGRSDYDRLAPPPTE